MSPRDHEVGGLQGAIRARDVRAGDLQEEPTKLVMNQSGRREQVVSSDPTKTAAPRANIAASGASQNTERAQRAEQLNTVIVGVIGRPHGVRGEVAIELRTDEPERRFAPGQVLGEEGSGRRFTVSSVRDLSSRLLVKFAELDDLAAADAVRGTVLTSSVEPDERPVEPDAFYDRQLIGLRVTTPAGVEVGAVRSVLHLPAQDVLEVETATGSRLVPFVAALVPEVDLEAGYLTVVDLAGLLDDRDNADEN